jgi:hypothetical protein
LLAEAKAALPHGAWRAWLAARVECSERTAQLYMQLARDWDAAGRTAGRRSALLTVLALVVLLAVVAEVLTQRYARRGSLTRHILVIVRTPEVLARCAADRVR